MKKLKLKIQIIEGFLALCILLVVFNPILLGLLDIPMKYKIVEEYILSPQESESFKLAVLIPKNGPYQEVRNLKIKGIKESETFNYDNVQVLRFQDKISQDTTIRIKYDVVLKSGNITWNEEILQEYLDEERGVEVNDDKIINKANSLVNGNSIDDVKAIYDFVHSHLEWPKGNRVSYGENIQSALVALETREGVCGEFANLMTALLRAKGIPAKSISGLSMPNTTSLFNKKQAFNHNAGAHAWVEFYADGKWHFADPSWGGKSHFSNVVGLHLSYGQQKDIDSIIAENISWVQEDMQITAAVSNPLKFISGSTNGLVQVKPVGYIDNRFKVILIGALISVIIFLEIYYWLRKCKDNKLAQKDTVKS